VYVALPSSIFRPEVQVAHRLSFSETIQARLEGRCM
jgi:hypothetical protein